jgi:hypothetical protein
MMPYSVHALYEAERVKTDAERRQADIALGMQAAAVSRFWQDISRPLGALRRHRAVRSGRSGRTHLLVTRPGPGA